MQLLFYVSHFPPDKSMWFNTFCLEASEHPTEHTHTVNTTENTFGGSHVTHLHCSAAEALP